LLDTGFSSPERGSLLPLPQLRPIRMSSSQSFVITILGTDEPGLIEALASAVADHGGNWVESRLSRLAGQFAGVIRVDVAPDRAGGLEDALRRFADLHVVIQPAASTTEPRPAGRTLFLELLGHDRPGIVREVSHAIAALGINVEELETECTSAPWTGDPLFKATARLALGPEISLDQLREDLETVAQELTLEIDLIERSPVT